MSKLKVGLRPLRRCMQCNYKTHHSRWLDDGKKCPVCGSAVGFSESSHGGLTELEIEERKAELQELQAMLNK